jgi:hypothetical protein
LLARQLLLERADLPVVEAIEHLVGMQAQVPRDPYVGLWSRLQPFDPYELGQLVEERGAVRMTLMRSTLHLVTAADAGPLRALTQPVIERAFASSPFRRDLDPAEIDEIVAAGIGLVEARPLTIVELGQALGQRWPARVPGSLAYAVRYLVPLVQVPPRGVWGRSGAARITTLRAWIGQPELPPADPGAAIVRYLRAFGPASPGDLRTWSWLTGVRPILDRLRPALVSYRGEDGRELLDVPDGLFADPEIPAPVRFLPEFDNAFLSHADRSRITGAGSWGSAYRGRGAFTVDGFLAGGWRMARDGPRTSLVVEPMTSLAAHALEAVEAEALALLTFLAPAAEGRNVEVVPGPR